MNFLRDSMVDSRLFYLLHTDITGHYTFVNDYFLEKFSFAAHNLIGLHYSHTIHPEDLKKYEEAVQSSLQVSKPVYIEIRKSDKRGNYFWTAWEITCIKDETGLLVGIQNIGTDISQYKNTQEYADRVDAIIENLADGLLILDKHFRIIRINRTYEKIFAQRQENLLRQRLWSVYSPDNYPKAYMEFTKAFQEKITIRFEGYYPPNGKWLDINVVPFEDMLLVFFRDITEKKHQTEALRQAKQQLTAFFDSTRDTIILISKDLKVLAFNKAAQESVKAVFQRDIKIGDSFSPYILPAVKEIFVKEFLSASQGNYIQKEIRLEVLPSVFVWYFLEYYPVRDEEGQVIGVAYCAGNIDERKKAEEHIVEQNRNLQAIAWLQSHSLRRPVASILGLVSLLEYDSDYEFMMEIVQHLKTTGEELDGIIHEIVKKTYLMTATNGAK